MLNSYTDKFICKFVSKGNLRTFISCIILWLALYFAGRIIKGYFLDIPYNKISFWPVYAELPLILAPLITL